ncbi:hypothetical protein D3C86_1702850 [compost metagenome]
MKHVNFLNMELLHKYYDQKRNVIAVLGHYGNWECLNIPHAIALPGECHLQAAFKPGDGETCPAHQNAFWYTAYSCTACPEAAFKTKRKAPAVTVYCRSVSRKKCKMRTEVFKPKHPDVQRCGKTGHSH